MKKNEAMTFIRRKIGFIRYNSVFDIYNETDEIPNELIELECAVINPSENSQTLDMRLTDAMKNYLMT
jgi:hypothetical protein